MKLRIMSDLHIESNPSYRPDIGEMEDTTTLVLAGDICEIEKPSKLLPFLSEMAKRFKTVIYVFGNHEFYRGNISTAKVKIAEMVKGITNLHILDDSNVIIDNINFIGCTLWTDMNNSNPITMWECKQGMNDYRYIRIGDTYKTLYPTDTVSLHKKSVKFLENTLQRAELLTNVIISHHLPCILSVHEKYRLDKLNSAYVTDLTPLMEQYSPTLWIHGHTHHSFDYMMYDTRVICNPRGYSNSRVYENKNFVENLIIEVNQKG